MSRLRDSQSPDHQSFLEVLPGALRLARKTARAWGVWQRDQIEDCEQVAAEALYEVMGRHDPTRAPLLFFAHKHVVGAVIDLITREAKIRKAGRTAALDCMETLGSMADPPLTEVVSDRASAARDPTDDDPFSKLKAMCREVAFVRFLGDMRELAEAQPDNLLARKQAIEAIRRMLGELSEQEARLLELRYWQGLSWSKVGQQVGLDEEPARRLDERLRKRLRRGLRRQGILDAPVFA